MIYFTTLILTLLFSHIVRATPACGGVSSSEELYDPTYSDAQRAQHALPIVVYNVTWTSKYGDKNASVSCSKDLAHRYSQYKEFPQFPYIGGSFDIKRGFPNCGECWDLTHLRTRKTIYITAIDSATSGFNITKEAFRVFSGGEIGNGTVLAEAKLVPRHFCGFK